MDENYFLNVEDTEDILVELLTGLGLSSVQRLEVKVQLKCLNAEHVFSSDKSHLIIRFFDDILDINATTNEKRISNPLVVYPNPVTSYLNISLDAPGQPYNIMIHSMVGKLVTSLWNSPSIDVSSLHKGMYLLKLESQGRTYSQKFLKL